MYYVEMGQRIKTRRLELKLTQEKLAEMVGLSTVYISQIENGRRHVTVNNLGAIANALKISIDELLKDSTFDNKNARLFELMEVAQELSPYNIDKVIQIVKTVYKEDN